MVVVEEEVYIIDQMSTSEPVVSVCPRCKKQASATVSIKHKVFLF